MCDTNPAGVAPMEPWTANALERLEPEVIVPAHCTGWKATYAIASRLPGAFIQNSVGTTFRLTATATT